MEIQSNQTITFEGRLSHVFWVGDLNVLIDEGNIFFVFVISVKKERNSNDHPSVYNEEVSNCGGDPQEQAARWQEPSTRFHSHIQLRK